MIRLMTAMTAAMLTLTASANAQQAGEGAEAFVRQVYATYGPDGDGALGEAALDRFWRPGIAALIRRDRELATDEPPYLDADPLCRCQDWESLRVTAVYISQFHDQIGPVRRAEVQFVNGDRNERVVLRLHGNPSHWRIEDVISDKRSLSADLAESNQRIEEGRRALNRD